MKHSNQNGFAGILIIFLVGVAIIAVGFVAYKGLSDRDKNVDKNQGDQSQGTQDEIYPNTDKPPVLQLFWGDQKHSTIPVEDVKYADQFGVWEDGGGTSSFKEGFEPATEIAIRLQPKDYAIYAYTQGVVTWLKDDQVAIRHGRNYALLYHHVARISSALKVGDKIELGTLIGYTGSAEAGTGKVAFWEIELIRSDSEGVWAINPVPFFDKAGQEAFDAVLKAGGQTSWVADANDKEAGWIAYVGKPEMCGDASKGGFKGDKDIEDCLKQLGLEWIVQ